LGLSIAGMLAAQEKPADSLALLRDAAITRAAEWDTLSQAMESKIARLLPCDTRVRSDIDEVSRASEARLTSLMQYLRAAEQRAADSAAAAEILISSQEARAAALTSERSEADGERAAIEGQLLDLGESAKQRSQFAQAQKTLAGIATLARQRVAQAQEEAGRSTALAASLRQLGRSYQNEQAALQAELNVLAAEAARWTEYYTARLDRAQTECAITNGTRTSAPRSSQGKNR
jgi:hypothetical protein